MFLASVERFVSYSDSNSLNYSFSGIVLFVAPVQKLFMEIVCFLTLSCVLLVTGTQIAKLLVPWCCFVYVLRFVGYGYSNLLYHLLTGNLFICLTLAEVAFCAAIVCFLTALHRDSFFRPFINCSLFLFNFWHLELHGISLSLQGMVYCSGPAT